MRGDEEGGGEDRREGGREVKRREGDKGETQGREGDFYVEGDGIASMAVRWSRRARAGGTKQEKE